MNNHRLLPEVAAIFIGALQLCCLMTSTCANDTGTSTDFNGVGGVTSLLTPVESTSDDEDQFATVERVPDEQRLYENLLMDYEPSVRPLLNTDGRVLVTFKLTLNQVVDLDERKQLLTTNVFINQEWTDEQLAWNESRYNGVKTLRVLSSNVWLPDTIMLNKAVVQSCGQYQFGLQGIYVLLKSSGTVVWPIPVRLRTTCKVDITYFPFDDQLCTILFGSSVYSNTRVDFKGSLITNDSNYVHNSEWDLLSITFSESLRQRLHRTNTLDYCNGSQFNSTIAGSVLGQATNPNHRCQQYWAASRSLTSETSEDYTELRYQLHIRRRSFYFAFNVIVPCLMLSVLTLLTFWLPATSNEKVSLGLSVFLTYSMFMLLIAEEVPTTSESVPLIGIYMITVMTMISVSVMMAVIVISCYNRGYRSGHPPRWVRRLVLDWLSFLLRMKHDVETTAANLRLADDVEKRYECAVHQKTTLKSRPPTPRPMRRHHDITASSSTAVRRYHPRNEVSSSNGTHSTLTASQSKFIYEKDFWNGSESSDEEARKRVVERNVEIELSPPSGGRQTSLKCERSDKKSISRHSSNLSETCKKRFDFDDEDDDAFYQDSTSFAVLQQNLLCSEEFDFNASSGLPVLPVKRADARSKAARTISATSKSTLRQSQPRLAVPEDCLSDEDDDELSNGNGHMSSKSVVPLKSLSAWSSTGFDEAGRALIASKDNESCPLAKALVDRKRSVVEWQAMAAVIDRLLFWVFLVGTVVAYIVILVVIPALKPSRSDLLMSQA